MTHTPIQRRLIPRKKLPDFGLKLPKDTVYVNIFTAKRGETEEEAHFLALADAEAWLATPPEPKED
ncbi:MAG: hypothetical protein QGH77_07540 [Planctomycetota bacterium]|nr:hypothetical protein [Planctomycetota bacterium]